MIVEKYENKFVSELCFFSFLTPVINYFYIYYIILRLKS